MNDFKSLTPLKTKTVLSMTLENIVIKNIKKLYLNNLVVKKLGVGLNFDNFFLSPKIEKSCPLPQKVLQ